MPKHNQGRTRDFHAEFFTDEKLGQCSLDAGRLFLGLVTLADREGCLEEPHPIFCRMKFFAAWKTDCASLLEELVNVGVVLRYRDPRDQRALMWLPGFRKRNRVHPRERNTVLWPCPADATPFANWFVRKNSQGQVLEPRPAHMREGSSWVVPRWILGRSQDDPRLILGARDLAGPSGPIGSTPPLPPSSKEGGDEVQTPTPPQRRRREQPPPLPAPPPCAGCGEGASAELAGVVLCYGCLPVATAWAQQQNPAEPWKADVTSWAARRREPAEPGDGSRLQLVAGGCK